MTWVGGHRGSGGTTIFTSARVRTEQAEHHRLPVRWPDRTRGYAVAEVVVPGGGRVVVVSVHLGLRADERVSHTEALLGRVDPRGAHLVVAGDLNEDESGPAYGRLVGGGGLRAVSPERPTFPARSPRRRLDLVLASAGLRVLPHRQVALPAGVFAAASDHVPTWVDLALP